MKIKVIFIFYIIKLLIYKKKNILYYIKYIKKLYIHIIYKQKQNE